MRVPHRVMEPRLVVCSTPTKHMYNSIDTDTVKRSLKLRGVVPPAITEHSLNTHHLKVNQ